MTPKTKKVSNRIPQYLSLSTINRHNRSIPRMYKTPKEISIILELMPMRAPFTSTFESVADLSFGTKSVADPSVGTNSGFTYTFPAMHSFSPALPQALSATMGCSVRPPLDIPKNDCVAEGPSGMLFFVL